MTTNESPCVDGRLLSPQSVRFEHLTFSFHPCSGCEGWIIYCHQPTDPAIKDVDLTGINAPSLERAVAQLQFRINHRRFIHMTADPLNVPMTEPYRNMDRAMIHDHTTSVRLTLTVSLSERGSASDDMQRIERLSQSIRDQLAYCSSEVRIDLAVNRTTSTDSTYDTEPF